MNTGFRGSTKEWLTVMTAKESEKMGLDDPINISCPCCGKMFTVSILQNDDTKSVAVRIQCDWGCMGLPYTVTTKRFPLTHKALSEMVSVARERVEI